MKLCIEIHNDTGFHHLYDGEYTIGTASDCDILLNDPALPDATLHLTIKEKKVYLSCFDAPGKILYLGAAIQHIVFAESFQISFGAARISGILEKRIPLRALLPWIKESALRWWNSLQKRDLRSMLVLLFLSFLLFTYLLLRIPAHSQFTSFNRQEIAKRGMLLARYLAEMNRDAIQGKTFSLLRTVPVAEEEGVLYAAMADSHGRILTGETDSPAASAVTARLQKLSEEKKPIVERENKGRIIILYPLLEGEKPLGWAVLLYDMGKAYLLPVPAGSFFTLLLFLSLLLIGALTALWIVRLFLNQIDELNDQLNIAMKNDDDQLQESIVPYKEMQHLRAGINRLLVHKRLPVSPASPPHSLARAENVPQEEGDGLNGAKELAVILQEQAGAWCVIHPVSFLVTECSEEFRDSFARPGAETGQHLIDVLEDMQLVNAVSELVDAPAEGARMKLDTPKALTLSVRCIGKDEILILFEEQHGAS